MSNIEVVEQIIEKSTQAQLAIADMKKGGLSTVMPCNGCENASQVGCQIPGKPTDVSFPIEDSGEVICPLQRGRLTLVSEIEIFDSEKEFLERDVRFLRNPDTITHVGARRD